MFESFIHEYGYIAVFVFACIEGEIAVLTAGFLCRQDLMSLKFVILAAFSGTLLTEQCLFFVGRIYGLKFLEKHPKLKKKSNNAIEFLRKYDSAFIFGCRFIYGIRNVSPMLIGAAKITPLKFSSLNVPAALIWSIVVAGAGYLFADVLESAKANLKYAQIGLLAILCAALAWFYYKKRKSKRSRRANQTR
ncbi:MAG: DedA family protein [Holosporaceae bacterium]|nr:DedA family protein [Holosporaceae bacterium]